MTDKKNLADRMNAEDGFRKGILSIIEAELSSKMREFGFLFYVLSASMSSLLTLNMSRMVLSEQFAES